MYDEDQNPIGRFNLKEVADRKARRTTFNLPLHTHKLAADLADHVGLSVKEFLDMIVPQFAPTLSEAIEGRDVAFRNEPAPTETEEQSDVRKTYVVASRVLASLETAEKKTGYSRDRCLALIVQMVSAEVSRSVGETLQRWTHAQKLLSEGFGELEAKLKEAQNLCKDMDWPDDGEPAAVLSKFTERITQSMKENINRYEEFMSKLEKLQRTNESEMDAPNKPNTIEEVQS